jgi:hypothetical protein
VRANLRKERAREGNLKFSRISAAPLISCESHRGKVGPTLQPRERHGTTETSATTTTGQIDGIGGFSPHRSVAWANNHYYKR